MKALTFGGGANLGFLFSMLVFARASAQGIILGAPQPAAYYFAGGVGSYDLDVNGDGTPDFVLSSQPDSALIEPLSQNSFVAIPETPPDLGYFVAPLPVGYSIGPSLDPVYQWYDASTDQFGAAAIGAQEDAGTVGYFSGQTAYAGFDLYYDDANHYGWMLIANPLSIVAGQVVDWAYQSTPNTPISAGEVPEPEIWALFAAGTAFLFCRRKTFV